MWQKMRQIQILRIADADENADDAETAEEELFDAEDVFGTEGETEAFAEDGNAVESGFVYGTANIPYADFFYGEMNDVQQNAEMQLDAADPVTAAGYREDGMYDAVTSCTNSKSKRYATSYYTENTENGSVTLAGIRDDKYLQFRQAFIKRHRKQLKRAKTAPTSSFLL